MKKILYIAGREFTTTVLTKGFVIGMLITPAMIALMAFVMPRMMTKAAPKIAGQVAIIDPTGAVKDSLASYLSQERFAERRAKVRSDVAKATPEALRGQVNSNPGAQAAIEQAIGQVPNLQVVGLPEGTDLEQAKAPLKTVLKGNAGAPDARLFLIVVHPTAVKHAEGETKFGTYDLYVRGKLDDRLVDEVVTGMREAITAARMKNTGLDPATMTALTSVPRPE